MYKKILIKISLLFIIFIILNFIYSKWFYEADIQKHSDIINLVHNIPNNADIIYVGESSNITFRSDDIDKRSISAFIGDYYPKLHTYDITKPASHAGIYKVLLDKIPEENAVKTIIVTLNLRSFNAQWIYSNLETSLQKSIMLLKPYPPLLNRFLLSFKAYDIKTDKEREQQFKRKWKKDKFHLPYNFQFRDVKEWDAYMWKHGIKNADGSKNLQLSELACHYIKAYGFQLDTLNHPRIKDFNKIVELAHNRGWNLVFNLMAENTQKAKELVGDDLIYMMRENARILEKYYSNKGVIVVNNLNSVEDKQFIDQNWTTEHYAEKGRKIIANNVSEALKLWHNDFYEEIENNVNLTFFFNDCENKELTWGQMQTITTEASFLGKNASKTGDGNDYSITMEYPLKVIPDSLKQNIVIDLMFNQTSLNHKARLVVEAQGANFSNYWNGYDLKNESEQLNKWIKLHKTISIPNSIKQADLIKIYVYNPSQETVYIDDFMIKIEE